MKNSSLSIPIREFLRSKQGRQSLLFLPVFGLTKMTSFFAMFFLSDMMGDITSFGLVEYALSMGLIIAIPLNCGLHSAYPYFVLKRNKLGWRKYFYLHSVLVSVAICSLLIIDFTVYSFIKLELKLALIIGALFAIQAMASVIRKSHKSILIAALIDGGFYLVISGYLLWMYVAEVAFNFNHLLILLTGYLLGLTAYLSFRLLELGQRLRWAEYRKILNYGAKLFISSLMIIALTMSSKIFIELFLGYEEVGFYSLYFRIAALTILIHQVVNVVFFQEYYLVALQKLDKFFSLFIIGIFLVSMTSFIVSPIFFAHFFEQIESSIGAYQNVFFLLSIQMVFWISMALNENIIYRENLAGKMNKLFAFVIAGMIASLYLLDLFDWMSIEALTLVNMLAIYIAVEAQFDIMRKNVVSSFSKFKWVNRGLCFFVFLYMTSKVLI